LLLTLAACDTSSSEADGTPNDQSEIQNPQSAIGWARDAVFYQIFPERFRNGDASNDPTRASIEFFENTPESWQVMPWTADWYERADWEKAIGDDFYEHGVFYRRYGGDLQGVIDKLDYLKTLGINTIYFNPVF
jgi:glycosidase